jgi:hypothetical protein
MMPPVILMLEDDTERRDRFQSVVVSRLPDHRLLVWRSAVLMMAEAEAQLPDAALIALDHDLIEEAGQPDPGDGLQVAKWLAERPPICPVVIHTSNTRRGDAMEGELQLAGWAYRRILPLGDDWIEVDWYHAVRKLLRARPSR